MKINKEIDYSTRDYEGFRTDMITGLQKRIPEYTDTSQSDAGIVILELLAHGLDLLSYYNDKTANEVYLDTARERTNIINIAKMMGYIYDDGRPSQFEQVFQITPQDTEFVIPKGYIVKTTESSVEKEVLFETDERLVIPPNCTGLEQDSEGNYLYSVTVTQGYTVSNEILGTSDNTPNQSFMLSEFPVIKGSVSITVTSPSEDEVEWTQVDKFLSSSPYDTHFTVTIDGSDRGIVNFGNDKSGKIPNTKLEGIVAKYRVGGGEVGNVSARTINQVDQKLAGLVATFNPYDPITLGVDKEEDEVIKTQAKSHFKSTWGAITLNDYTDLAKTFDEIRDALSVHGDTPFDVIVYILPHKYDEMTDRDLTNLRNKLSKVYVERKVLGVDVYLRFAEKVHIHPNIDIVLHHTVEKNKMKDLIDNVIIGTFKGETRLLGETLYPSQIISELMSVEGIVAVNCTINDLPSEIGQHQFLNVESYTLNITGGI